MVKKANPGRKGTKKQRRRTVRMPAPFSPFAPWELSAALSCGDTQVYDEMASGKMDFICFGRLRRIPYAIGKARLGNPSDEQIAELRRDLAERRIAALGDRAIVDATSRPRLTHQNHKEEEDTQRATAVA